MAMDHAVCCLTETVLTVSCLDDQGHCPDSSEDRPAWVCSSAPTAYSRSVRTQRQVVDYSLQKRALLRDLYSGRVSLYEVCDASPYLKNAARYHGDQTSERCPVCRRENLWHVHYIYGDELKQSAGQARSKAELSMLAMSYREFDVFVVEVCRGCNWNYLVERYLLGRDGLTDPQQKAHREAAE